VTPHFWLVLTPSGVPMGTCNSESDAKDFALFMNRRGRMPKLRIVEYAPASLPSSNATTPEKKR
jgi:hypothetical protein